MIISLYKTATWMAGPFLPLFFHYRLKKGKEDPQRISERWGKTQKKPMNKDVIWVHAASVGEAQAALILASAIYKRYPKLHMILTTVTTTAAKLVGDAKVSNLTHQYAPVDHPLWIRRFLNHWQPKLALYVESELWPNMLLGLQKRNIPAILVNGRLSDASFFRWRYARKTAEKLLKTFDTLLVQDNTQARRLQRLGGNNIIVTGNLKVLPSAKPTDQKRLKAIRESLKGQKVWCAASTHDGEEDIVINAMKAIQQEIPDVKLILVPRHPERAKDVTKLLDEKGLAYKLSSKDLPSQTSPVYLVDEIGILDVCYNIAEVSFIGGSLLPHLKGHNLMEAVQEKSAVIHGPYTSNVRDLTSLLQHHHASKIVKDEKSLEETVVALLKDKKSCKSLQDAGKIALDQQSLVKDRVIKHIEAYL